MGIGQNKMKHNRTDREIVLRAFTFFRDASFVASLMAKRIHEDDPEDDEHPRRRWDDWQTFITHLWRMRRMALLMGRAESAKPLVEKAVSSFDEVLPNLKSYRDVIEHIEAYVFEDDNRHNKSINASALQVGTFSKDYFSWPISGSDDEMHLKSILIASSELFVSMKEIKDTYAKTHN
jgi:hypothetical protein